jgi:hypothetical protein
MKTLLQIFEENHLLDSPETENLIKKIDDLIKKDLDVKHNKKINNEYS